MRRRAFLGSIPGAIQVMATSIGRAATRDRVVIAGAGIMGASIGYHLARRGARVTIVEKERPGAGATQNSFAWINATFSKQPRSYFELNLAGIAGWRRLSLEFGSELQIQWGGSVEWAAPGDGARKLLASVRHHEAWGYPTRLIDAASMASLFPAVSPGPVGAACFSEIDGTLDPMHALNVLLARARAAGAEVQHPCEVTGISISGGRVKAVETTQGSMEADYFVIAAGTGSTRLARMAEVHVPLKESPGALAHTRPLKRLLDHVALAPGATIKQNPDGRIVTGTDFGGSPVTEAAREYGMTLLGNARRFLPALESAELETTTLGHRVLPLDEYPIVGFTGRCPNLYIAAMHSGITLSPLIGQLAAMEILDGADVDLLKPYRPSRFA
jgi:glycine/D-amino acid oxidase-like deaminating enzyme